MGSRSRVLLAAGTVSATDASGAVTTGNRWRALAFTITSADDDASTLLVVRPDGVVEPRVYGPWRFDGTTAPVPCGPATPTVTTTDLLREDLDVALGGAATVSLDAGLGAWFDRARPEIGLDRVQRVKTPAGASDDRPLAL